MSAILGAYRFLAGLALACVCVAPGCSNLIGLDGYGVGGGEPGGASDGGGRDRSDGAKGGSTHAGAPGTGGEVAVNGGSAGKGNEAGSAELAGSAGAASECAAGCDDANECTEDSCASGSCVHLPAVLGAACGVGRSCDARAICVRCRDTAAGTAQDEGCPATAPVCVGTGLAANCEGCVVGSDCNDDNECTSETCNGGKCVSAPVAAGDPCSGGGVCNGTADAAKCVHCADSALITADPAKGNGSFEKGIKPALGWEEDGPYFITKNCSSGCQSGSNTGITYASAGKVLAWLAGTDDAGIGDLNRIISLPVGAAKLHVQADTNFQTSSKSVTNLDYFKVRLMDASYTQLGSDLFAKSAADAQIGNAPIWSSNGIDVIVDVSAYAGSDVSISFWSSVDTSLITDFFIDNVRVSVSVCQ